MDETYRKLCDIMMWERGEGEDYKDVVLRKDIKPQQIPDKRLIDVIHANSLENWAKKQKHETLDALKNEIIEIMRMAIVNPILFNKQLQEKFPPIYNFCIYASGTDRRGKLVAEAEKISEVAWWGDLAQIRLKEKTDKIFSVKPDPKKYLKISNKIKQIWGFTDAEIEGFRYFVCQSRHENHNPSMNKSLYLFSGKKRTGKTTLARALAAILNGEEKVIDGAKFESSFNKELQINDHDLPMAAQANATILDEAMPKDSRKSYGRVKSMMTSNYCSYNQKFGKIMTILVKRFYLYTSNDHISELIQDTSERRFILIIMDKMPEQISFEEIYDIWKEFAQNCIPEKNWQEWYNTFEDLEGLERKEIIFYKNILLSDRSILLAVRNTFDYSLTLQFFLNIIIRGKATRDEKKALQAAIEELVGKPKGYRWSRKLILETLEKKTEKQDKMDREEELLNSNDLPEEDSEFLEDFSNDKFFK